MNLEAFVNESNRIEGIHRRASVDEIAAHEAFVNYTSLSVNKLCALVSVLQPNALLRDKVGRDVRVGKYRPPDGGPAIRVALTMQLDKINRGEWHDPYTAHIAYEMLHPFTDGNGRSGRAIWLWMMKGHAPLGFLHHWYYQSLQASQ
jgi:hypothetical protein